MTMRLCDGRRDSTTDLVWRIGAKPNIAVHPILWSCTPRTASARGHLKSPEVHPPGWRRAEQSVRRLFEGRHSPYNRIHVCEGTPMQLSDRFERITATMLSDSQAIPDWSLSGRFILQYPPGAPVRCNPLGDAHRTLGVGVPCAVNVSRQGTDFVELRPQGTYALELDWANAWLHEYRCNCRYLAVLYADETDDLELRHAWLDWWHAACASREALRRLES